MDTLEVENTIFNFDQVLVAIKRTQELKLLLVKQRFEFEFKKTTLKSELWIAHEETNYHKACASVLKSQVDDLKAQVQLCETKTAVAEDEIATLKSAYEDKEKNYEAILKMVDNLKTEIATHETVVSWYDEQLYEAKNRLAA